MNERPKRGISCKGLDEDFNQEEIKKSNLILEAGILSERQRYDEAANKYAEAAVIETRLSTICEGKGLLEKSWVHSVSAMNCWARAGNYYSAIRLGETLLDRTDLPDRLRRHVQGLVQPLRRLRSQYTQATAPSTAEAVSS
jgi:hypothetical protein